MKHFISRRDFLKVAGAVGAAGALAACGGSSSSSTAASTSASSSAASGAAGGNVSISLWTYPIGSWGGTESKLDDIIAAFNAVHPEITVTYETLDYQNGDNLVTSAITAKETPDLIMEGPERLVSNWGANNLMVDLSDLWAGTEEDIAAVSASVVSACQLDGAYYEYPLCMTTHCMAINYEVFEAAGALQYIDEETRTWTTDDFVAAMAAIRDAAAAGTVNVATPGIVYCGAQGGDQGTRALVNNLYSDYYVNEDGTSYTANSENNVKALTLLQTMVNDGSLSANASYAAADELQSFANQTCAVSFCWNYSNYTQYAEQTQFTPFAMAFPSDDSQPELEMAGPYGFGVFDKGDEAKIEAAKTFIDFVCNDQTVGTEAVKTTGFFPVHADWGDVYEGDADADLRAPFALMSDYTGRYYSLTEGWTEQRGFWWPMLAEILTTGADPQTAADSFVEQANANIG